MAGTYTENRNRNTVMGNKIVKFFTVTNYTNTETLTVGGMRSIDLVVPTVTGASESVGYTKSGNVITFATAADSYDGEMMVIGN